MRSWILEKVAVFVFRVHVFVHLGERARKAATHDAAVATLCWDVVSIAYKRTQVADETKVNDQECNVENGGNRSAHGAENRGPTRHGRHCQRGRPSRLEYVVDSRDKDNQEAHIPGVTAVVSARLWGTVFSTKVRSVRGPRSNMPNETGNDCDHHHSADT